MESFEHLVNTLGVPVAILAWLAVTTWAIARWMASNLILPVTARHLEFMDQMISAIPTQVDAVTGINDKLTTLKTIDEQQKLLNQQSEIRHRELLDALKASVCKAAKIPDSK